MRTLDGGDELFFEESVVDFYNNVMHKWDFGSKRIALLMGCTFYKPYSKSPLHFKVIEMLYRRDLSNCVQEYIVGHPLVICPREWERKYPAAHYNFPPERLGEDGRRVFIARLKKFFEKAEKHDNNFVCFATDPYKPIIFEASEHLFTPLNIPYDIRQVPTLIDKLTWLCQENRKPKLIEKLSRTNQNKQTAAKRTEKT